ncbi:hypothetical protein EXIGLDRAFT_780560 [Exidia glandulosa HHB12029]|uniref:Uncharacterized protein n=1 Tax=Exidia glandulosa HHB12029 TaxID=1314781 RepID=A0A165BK14_EXIGL|nr:hypothetical protein EXIGLDRAFT_780560 [Exidia glandulosa HHB12029]
MSALPHDLTIDEANLISSWMEGWLIGMHSILYCFCMRTLWPRRESTTSRYCQRPIWTTRTNSDSFMRTCGVLMTVTTIMVVLAIAHAALSLRGLLEAGGRPDSGRWNRQVQSGVRRWAVIRTAAHKRQAAGPTAIRPTPWLEAFSSSFHVGGSDGRAYYGDFAKEPYKLKNVIYVINTFMADGLLLWRVWVVWSYSWKVTCAPAIMFLGTMIAEIFTTISLWALKPNESLFTPTVGHWFTSFWSLSLATNVTCTTLIVIRIFRSSLNSASYRAVIAVVIESGALYTLSIVFHMTLYELRANAGQIANDVQTQLAVIGPTLIVVVVGRRMAHPPSAIAPKPEAIVVEITEYVETNSHHGEAERKATFLPQISAESV